MPNTQLEKLKNITPINLGVNDIAIAKMIEEYGNLDATTPKEFKELTAGIAVFRNARLLVSERKEELKRPLIDEGKAIDAECKRLVALIEQPEETLKERKKAYEAEQDRKKKEKEEAEANRIKTIEDRINAFFVNTRGLVGKNSAELKEKLQFFISCTEADDFDYQEFAIKADEVKRTVLAELEEAYKEKVDQENKDAQIEKERLEAERVAKFNYLLSLIKIASDKYLVAWQTCLISDMESAIKNLMEFDYSDYEEFQEDAESARSESIKTLNELIENRKAYDSDQAELAELRAKNAERERKELEDKQAADKKLEEEKFNAVVADADKVFVSDVAMPVIETKLMEVAQATPILHTPTIEDIYQHAKIAESRGVSYQEYFVGLCTINDLVTAFVELYEKGR